MVEGEPRDGVRPTAQWPATPWPTAPPPQQPPMPSAPVGPPKKSTGLIVVAGLAVAALIAACVYLGASLVRGGSSTSADATQASSGGVQTTGVPIDKGRVGPLKPVSVTAT